MCDWIAWARAAQAAEQRGDVADAVRLWTASCSSLHDLTQRGTPHAREVHARTLEQYLSHAESLRATKPRASDRPERTPARQFRLATGDPDAWDAIVGQVEAKEALVVAVDAAKFVDIRAPHSFVLYGPPGTGKTMLARALAGRCDRPFIEVTSSDLVVSLQGESEQAISRVFAEAAEAGAVLFMDEIESLGGSVGRADSASTSRILNTVLTASQKDCERFIWIGATNHPELVDRAVWRRFEVKVLVDLPTRADRAVLLAGVNASPSELQELLDLTEGFSSCDVSTALKIAGGAPMRRAQRVGRYRDAGDGRWVPCDCDADCACVAVAGGRVTLSAPTLEDFVLQLRATTPTSSPAEVEKYRAMSNRV